MGVVALLPGKHGKRYCAIMLTPDVSQSEESLAANTQRELTNEEIAEAKESLRRYFEIGWQIASRLQREGGLDEVLTNAEVNPTVKPPRVDLASSDSSQTII